MIFVDVFVVVYLQTFNFLFQLMSFLHQPKILATRGAFYIIEKRGREGWRELVREGREGWKKGGREEGGREGGRERGREREREEGREDRREGVSGGREEGRE